GDGGCPSAAAGEGPAAQAALYEPDQVAPADLQPVLQRSGSDAGFISALSGERAPAGFRAARRAHSRRAEAQRQPLRGEVSLAPKQVNHRDIEARRSTEKQGQSTRVRRRRDADEPPQCLRVSVVFFSESCASMRSPWRWQPASASSTKMS